MSSASTGLQEPLLSEQLPDILKNRAAASARAGQGRTPPVAWVEFTDNNGRGRAALTAFLLGIAFCAGPLLLMLLPSAAPFAIYWSLLVLFHLLEYLLTAAFRPDTLSFDNFLLNHSVLYQLMVAVAFAEYWLEWWLFGGMKQWGPLATLGALLSVMGLATRTVGMATASTNFSHQIEDNKRQEHTLVTHGIYSVLRHPAYFGFFWWSVGTQVLLLNPLCFVAYTAASWHFFYERIPHEEELLLKFFGANYLAYRKQSYIGIPLIEWACSTFPP